MMCVRREGRVDEDALWVAVDFVCADVAKDVNRLACFRVGFDVESENVLDCDVAFPDMRMTLHFADAKRGMKRRVFSA